MKTATDSSGNTITARHGTLFQGEPIIFGVCPEITSMPITNLMVSSRVRFKMRKDEFARAFVKTTAGIFEFLIMESNGALQLCHMQHANFRIDHHIRTDVPATDAPRFDAGAH